MKLIVAPKTDLKNTACERLRYLTTILCKIYECESNYLMTHFIIIITDWSSLPHKEGEDRIRKWIKQLNIHSKQNVIKTMIDAEKNNNRLAVLWCHHKCTFYLPHLNLIIEITKWNLLLKLEILEITNFSIFWQILSYSILFAPSNSDKLDI